MTQKEFKAAMIRGLGRCVMAVEKDPERYRKPVLWACGHDLSFDAQCEGSRAWYVYQMVCKYPDRSPFVAAAVGALERCRPGDCWQLAHLCGLLSRFAEDGDNTAQQALEDKYHALLVKLETRKTRRRPVFHERDALERLCVTLATEETACVRIAEDLGRLYLTRSYLQAGDFEWLYGTVEQKYGDRLRKAAKTSPEIACFLAREEAWLQTLATHTPERPALSQMRGGLRSRRLRFTGDRQTIDHYAELYRRATDPRERADGLMSFAVCPYPHDPAPILLDAKSADAELAHAAVLALGNICDPAVREFALREIREDPQGDTYLPLLTRNHQPGDEALLETLMEHALAEGDLDKLHGIHLQVLKIFDRGDTGPERLLPGIYETIPCGCCRRKVVRLMGERGVLTERTLEECLYDSDEDTRHYAAGYFKQPKAKDP